MTERRIEVGHVRSVNPAKRQLRLIAEAGREQLVPQTDKVVFILEDGSEMRCRVKAARALSDRANEFTVELAEGVNRDSVARMRNAVLAVTSAATEEDDYAPSQLLGLDAYDASGAKLGTVRNMYLTGANYVVEIRTASGSSLLTPVIEPAVACVDIKNRRLVLGDYEPYTVEEPEAARIRR
jgi:16S rRNA processing protein RimM